MKLGFICPNLPGHLNPMTTLARHLQARGHDGLFLYSKEANGLPFVPSPEKDHISENRTEQSKRQGEDALRSGVGQVLAQTEAIFRSRRRVVRDQEEGQAKGQVATPKRTSVLHRSCRASTRLLPDSSRCLAITWI
jgi:hypothetical protein